MNVVKRRKTLDPNWKPSERLQKLIDENEKLPCKACGERPRRGRWSWCQKCTKQYHNRGVSNPPPPLKLQGLFHELEISKTLIRQNLDSPPIQEGLSLITATIEQASRGVGPLMPSALRYLGRLHHGKIDPIDILTVLGAVWIVHYLNDGRTISDRQCWFEAANLVCRLVAIPSKIEGEPTFTPPQKKAVAIWIHDALGTLLVNIAHAGVEMMKARQKREEIFRQPLKVDVMKGEPDAAEGP